MTDRLRFETGLAAEDAVARHYTRAGGQVRGTRIRTAAGEIDLIVETPAGEIVFVEVKARRNHRAAAQSVSARQQARIATAAEIWLAEHGPGPLTPCRFDVATVDDTGRVRIIENAFGAAG
ncbi:MAG: YraN family protein [Pseudomonadota bacterium]